MVVVNKDDLSLKPVPLQAVYGLMSNGENGLRFLATMVPLFPAFTPIRGTKLDLEFPHDSFVHFLHKPGLFAYTSDELKQVFALTNVTGYQVEDCDYQLLNAMRNLSSHQLMILVVPDTA
jgi:hypothetical protein